MISNFPQVVSLLRVNLKFQEAKNELAMGKMKNKKSISTER